VVRLRKFAIVLATLLLAACHRAASDRAPIIIIVADALRHDYASLPDYVPDPRGFARLKATATDFRKCVTTMPMTRGSFPGLLSGEMTGTLDASARQQSWVRRLHDAGYRTTFIASSYAFGTDPSSVDVGPLFDDVDLENVPGRVARPMPEALNLLDRALARRKSDRILVIVHLFYPHAPYWKGSYGASVTQLDHEIAAALDILQRRGVYERAHVIVTSDHGESLQEHDAPPQHGWNVYDEETRVPLLWKLPGQHQPRVVNDLVRNYDIGPTLVRLVGARDTARPSLRSAVPIAALTGEGSAPPIAFHAALESRMDPIPQIAVRTNRYLLIENTEGFRFPELYDYERDPAELYNIAGSEEGKRVMRDLEPWLAQLKQIWIDVAREQREALTPEMRKTLESLGYLGTAPSSSQPWAPLEVSPVPGLRVRFRECFSRRWTQYAAETYDSLFPVRLVDAGGELFVIANSTGDLSRLRSRIAHQPGVAIHGPEYADVWFERRTYALAPESTTLFALLDGRLLKRYFVDPNDYRLDSDGQTFGKVVATLEGEFTDLLDAGTLGVVLFQKDAVYLRGVDGHMEILGRFASDADRAAVEETTGTVFVADGLTILRLHAGDAPQVFATTTNPILSLAIRGDELWVGTHPFPPSPANDKTPVVIYNTRTARQIGTFGSRLLHPTNSFWSAVDVGPFGIAYPRQMMFHGDRLYVLDSGLERILSFDLF